MAVTTTIVEESRSESADDSGVTVERVLRVRPWSARLDVIGSLLGGIRQVGRALIRTPPARDPWLPWCFCTSVKSTGLGKFLGSADNSINHLPNLNYYDGGALLTASYKTLTYEAAQGGSGLTPPEEIELASEAYDFSAVQLTLPNKRYGWNDTGTPADPVVGLLAKSDVAGTKTLPRLQYSMTRHYVAVLPMNAITQQLGRINKSAVKMGSYNYPAETMRFESLSATRKVTSRGIKFFEVVYKFAVQPIYDRKAEGDTDGYVGWNRIYRPDTGKWQYVGLAADPTKRIYLLDEDGPTQTIRGRTWKGFNLLFHPWAQ